MSINIRLNAQKVQLVTWPPRAGDGPSWLRDKASLRSALREAVADSQGAAGLRELLRDAGAGGVGPATDDQLVELAVGLVEEGRLMLLPPEWRWRPKLVAATTKPSSAAPAQAGPVPKAQRTWFQVKVVDEKTGDPVSSVRLKITLPDGVEDYYTTSAGGLVRIDDIPAGTCDISCDLTGATMQDTYEFKGVGEPPPPAPDAKVWPSRKIGASNLKRIAEIERHKVKDGESILSLATAAGFDWKFLARFNWGTDVPKEINRRLVDDEGIWKKTKDGKNYMFTSTDHPGIVFIPKKWEKTGLSTATEHVFKVRHIVPMVVRLETIDGHRIPEASYTITWSNKDQAEGTLGPQGIDMIEDPPPGPFQIEYKDLHEVLAKGLAAQARALIEKKDRPALLQVLKYDTETVAATVKFYDKYFNTYSGKGMVEDLYKQFTDPNERAVMEFLLVSGGVKVKTGAEVAQDPIDEPLDIETDASFGKVGALEPGGGANG